MKTTEDGSSIHTPHHNVDSLVGVSALGQQARAASLPVTLASDEDLLSRLGEVQAEPTANTVLGRLKQLLVGTTLAAGENHIGEVGQSASVVTVNPTVSTSPAYSAGDSVGGKITLAGALRTAGKPASLDALMILDRSNQKPAGYIAIFDADPAAATLTDNEAAVFSTDDQKVVALIEVASGDYKTIGGKAYASLSSLGRVLVAAAGTTLYAAFVATSTPTFAATTDLQLKFSFIHT